MVRGVELVKVLITGGRGFQNEAQIEADLRSLLSLGLSCVIHGMCPEGADMLADRVACRLLGVAGVKRFPADWNAHGKGAGHIRNVQMLDECEPGLVLGYPDPKSRGTWHCLSEAAARNIRTLAFIPWWEGDIAELVERETKRYQLATGLRRGTHVQITKKAA